MKSDDSAEIKKLEKEISKEYPQLSKEELIEAISRDEEKLEQLSKKMKKTKKEIFYWLHLMG